MTLKKRSALLQGFEPEDWLPTQAVSDWLNDVRPRIQVFWDRYPKDNVLFTESDFEHVAWGLTQLRSAVPSAQGDRMLVEWGCGFGVISGMASLLGWSAIGIEAEEFLVEEARAWHKRFGLSTHFSCGSFLPVGSQELATDEDPRVALRYGESLETGDANLKEAGVVFVYAWPGEEHFLKQVFYRFAPEGCFLMLYLGPQQMELFQKLPSQT